MPLPLYQYRVSGDLHLRGDVRSFLLERSYPGADSNPHYPPNNAADRDTHSETNQTAHAVSDVCTHHRTLCSSHTGANADTHDSDTYPRAHRTTNTRADHASDAVAHHIALSTTDAFADSDTHPSAHAERVL